MRLYRLKDKVTDKWVDLKPYPLIGAENDEDAVRRAVPELLKEGFNLNDIEIYDVADMEEDRILNVAHKKVEWNVYKHPETKADLLKPLKISEETLDNLKKEKL